MSSKRKNDDASTLSGREKKKQKTALARTIAVQSVTTSGSATPASNAEAGPSKGVRFNDGANLPGSLDVERFAEARAFEMNAMHTAMQSARASGTQRAWQQLPRHLRRRAASHDVRRVPARLREKARDEMDPPKAKKKSIPKRGKSKRISRTQELLRRQENKVWLETHIWHAKRMHMCELWGYKLAITPTEKSFRPSHRASMHGSILHDASYMGLIELQGSESVLKAIFDSCCDAQAPSPAAKRYLAGARTCNTHLYERDAYPRGLIAPITVLWRAVETGASSSSTAASAKSMPKAARNSKGKERTSTAEVPERTVWVWVHPSVFETVYVEIRTAASFALEAAKEAAGPTDAPFTIEIADLRDKLNVFEIMGPKSSQVIKGALKPVADDTREEFKKCWSGLDNLQTTASVPRNVVIGFKVYDPRLNFPPKNAKIHIDKGNLPSASAAATAFFPSSTLARSEIWDEDVRRPLQKPKFMKKDIDARRSEHLVPGKPLQAQVQDARIPALLIQRSVEASSATSSDHTPSVHGWTLIVPQGWGMPFFSSLIFTGTRVGGQHERENQAFESGTTYFPGDYPSTLSYDEYSAAKAETEQTLWESKPPAKRPNYELLGCRSPWQPDWEVVLGLRQPGEDDTRMEDASTVPGEFVPAQREMDVDGPDAPEQDPDEQLTVAEEQETLYPWLLRGPSTRTILDSLIGNANPASLLFAKLEELRGKRGLPSLAGKTQLDDLWKSALVNVRLRLVGRGRPDELAVIYGMDDAETAKWHRAEQLRKKPVVDELEQGETELSVLAPSQGSIIGYVTTGNFSLSIGEGLAIGAIPVTRYIELCEQAKRLGSGLSLLVKVRDRHEAICRAARVELLE